MPPQTKYPRVLRYQLTPPKICACEKCGLESLLPFATAWIAHTRLTSSPVVFYAGLFGCIDIAYNFFEHEVLTRADAGHVPEGVLRMARGRSLGVLTSFTTALLVAFVAPRLGFGLICGTLILHLRPEAAPGSKRVRSFINECDRSSNPRKPL